MIRALFLLFISSPAFAQDTCGTWQPVVTSEAWPDSGANWIYDQWKVESVETSTPSWYCPCACPSATVETQSRIDRETGDIEVITRQTSYMYIRKEKTDFEKTVEMFE